MENFSARDDATIEIPPSVRVCKRAGYRRNRVMLVMVILLVVLSGIWFLGVHPSLQYQTTLQIDRDLNQAEANMQMLLSADRYRSQQNILINEKSLSNYLTIHNTYASQAWQVIVTPANVTTTLRFPGCGQDCTLTAILNIDNSSGNYTQIQVTSVHAQGMLALILSDGELANVFNKNLQNFDRNLTYLAMKVTLLEHAIEVQLH